MKYLEQYIEEKLKIKVLGKLTTRESNSGEEVGVSLVIDGYEPGIEVWYADYATWLEKKIETGAFAVGESIESSEKMVPIKQVKQWLNKSFYDSTYYGVREVMGDFISKKEMFVKFSKEFDE